MARNSNLHNITNKHDFLAESYAVVQYEPCLTRINKLENAVVRTKLPGMMYYLPHINYHVLVHDYFIN